MSAAEFPPDMEAGVGRVKRTAVFRELAALERFRGYDLAAAAVYLMLQDGRPPGEIRFSSDIYWPLAQRGHITRRLVYGNLRTFLSAASRCLPHAVSCIMEASCSGMPPLQSFLLALHQLASAELRKPAP